MATSGTRPLLTIFKLAIVSWLVALMALPAVAATGSSTGLPLPRFVTTGASKVNVRVGPGTRYNVAWIYLRQGLPVEVVAEFDTWRKIRDIDGQEGWVQQNLLSGGRAGYVSPWTKEGQIPLRVRASEDAGVRAYLVPNFRVQISSCDGQWCEVSATDHPANGRPSTYSGFLHQNDIWGVYQSEEFD